MKFHELHVGQSFIPLNKHNTRIQYTKVSHSTAQALHDEPRHFAATDEVDGLQPSNKHPQPTPKYPIPPSDHVGGIGTLGHAMQYLSQDARRNFHENPKIRRDYALAAMSTIDILDDSFDELSREHKNATLMSYQDVDKHAATNTP